MRLATFNSLHRPRLGLVEGDFIIDLAKAAGETKIPGNTLSLIEAGPAALKKIARLAAKAPKPARKPLASVHLLAPIPRPRRNVMCLGLNYFEHAQESLRAKGLEVSAPEHPIFFTKTTTAVNGPYDDILLDPAVTEKLDWEVELGVVIGKSGKNIPREQAMEHVFGYTVINDISARDLQRNHQQFFVTAQPPLPGD